MTVIPDDILEAAFDAWTSVPTADWEQNATEIIANAILSERERCAKIVEASRDDISVFATAIADEIRGVKS